MWSQRNRAPARPWPIEAIEGATQKGGCDAAQPGCSVPVSTAPPLFRCRARHRSEGEVGCASQQHESGCAARRARARRGGRVRFRWFRDGLPPRGGGPWRRRAGARAGLSAGLVPSHPCADGPGLLGPEPGAARPVRRVDVPGHRRRDRQRSRGRLADLRERSAAQGRTLVHLGRSTAGRRVRALAAEPRGPRAALRRGGADAHRHAVPVRGDDGQDPRAAPGRRAAGAGLAAAAAGGVLRTAGRERAGTRRFAGAATLRQPARPAPADLPAVRGVRHRLQRRRQEHARPHLPVGGGARRRRPADGLRGARPRPPAGRGLRGQLRGARAGGRGPPDVDGSAAAAATDLRPARADRGHLRHHLPAAAQPRRLSRAEPGAGHALLRQRRSPHLRAGRPAGRRQPTRARGQSRTRHHQRGADR